MNMAFIKLKNWWGHYILIAILLRILCAIFPNSILNYYSTTANIILYLIIAQLTYNLLENCYNDEKIDAYKKAVLITGCDSGFGYQLAKRMDSKGFHVFATCLFPDGPGASQLKSSCSSRLKVLYLDVTKDESIEEAFVFVKKNLGSNELWAVVNNAGSAMAFCSFEFSTMENFKSCLDVNTLGPVRVTKIFLPLLKKSKGRIINVTSLSGRIALVDTCAYTISKYATVALTECLSQEMRPWGIRVISIEPEMFRTALTEDVIGKRRKEVDKISKDILATYGEEYLKNLEKFTALFVNFKTSNLSVVVDVMELAICLKNPSHVYKPCRNILFRFVCYILEIMPFALYERIFNTFNRILGYPLPKDAKINNSH